MSLPTPLYDLKLFSNVYEPSEDTFLMLDALECDINFIKSLNPVTVVEIGSGSGVVITFLAAALKSCLYFASDINPEACVVTLKTANMNNVHVETINMNLLDNFKHVLFDIILFNPPYVVTENNELGGKGLNRAWAGGFRGREMIDNVLCNLKKLLSDKGVCYMVVIKDNNPDEIADIMLGNGFSTDIVKERRILGEHLFILKFCRINKYGENKEFDCLF